MNFSDIKKNSILIVPDHLRKKIIKERNNNPEIKNIKILSFDDIKKSLFFDFDEKSIHYIMDKYQTSYNVAIMYLNSLFFIIDNDKTSEKVEFLKNLKDELTKNNLLIIDDLFGNFLKSKEECYVYGFDLLNKFQKYMLEKIKDYINVTIISKKENNFSNKIYELSNIEEEVSFVAERISELIHNGIDLKKIYLCNIQESYERSLERVFKFFNIPLNLKKKCFLYETELGKYFLDNLDLDKNVLIKNIKIQYLGNDDYSNDIYKILINFINKYAWADNIKDIKSLIKEDFKKVKIPNIKYNNAIETAEIVDNIFYEDEYVFLLNFNLNEIPKIKKDEDYISDNLKPAYINTSDEENAYNKEKLIKAIKNIKNITITCKSSTENGEGEISYLNKILKFEVIKTKNLISNYSNITNKLMLARAIDNKLKYNIIDENLEKLDKNYDIGYHSFSNKYKLISPEKIINYVKDNINFSSSNIDTYYNCPFKFYCSNILRIQKYEQNFGGKLGSFFHYCLENRDNITPKEAYENLIKEEGDTFSNKEKFFLEKSVNDIDLIIDILKEQNKHSKHTDELCEKEIEIVIKRKIDVTLKGFIDKILLLDNKIIIVDYKTNNQTVDPDYFCYGLKMQLPIYNYLLKMTNPEYKIAGIFIQHLLPTKANSNRDELFNFLKLDGIFTTNIDLIKDFDDTFEKSKIIKRLSLDSKTGDIKTSKFSFSDEEFSKLFKDTQDKINECIDSVLNADFKISPVLIKNKINACEFCEFKDVCYKTYDDIRELNIVEEVQDE